LLKQHYEGKQDRKDRKRAYFSTNNKQKYKLTMETFYDVIAGDQLVLVDFFATWCQPCKMMHPVLQQVKEVLGDRIRIIKIDVDTHAALSQQYQIQSVPTLMLFRRGEVLWRASGAMPKAELLSTIDPFLQ
jgi:thioredoxin 1